MENFEGLCGDNCCVQAEQLVERIYAMDEDRVELAYRRLVELLGRAQRRRLGSKAVSQTA